MVSAQEWPLAPVAPSLTRVGPRDASAWQPRTAADTAFVLDLPRSVRLLSGADFKRVFDGRRQHGTEVFRIHFANSAQARLGMAVSRRVSAKAVVRNRIRRQIRESFRLNRPHLAPMDYVVLARAPAAGMDRSQLRAALETLWQRFNQTA